MLFLLYYVLLLIILFVVNHHCRYIFSTFDENKMKWFPYKWNAWNGYIIPFISKSTPYEHEYKQTALLRLPSIPKRNRIESSNMQAPKPTPILIQYYSDLLVLYFVRTYFTLFSRSAGRTHNTILILHNYFLPWNNHPFSFIARFEYGKQIHLAIYEFLFKINFE